MGGMQIETLLLVLLSTGLLFVLILMAAVLWVVLTILFKLRRAMMKTKSAAGKGLSFLKLAKPAYPLALLGALAAWLWPDKEEG